MFFAAREAVRRRARQRDREEMERARREIERGRREERARVTKLLAEHGVTLPPELARYLAGGGCDYCAGFRKGYRWGFRVGYRQGCRSEGDLVGQHPGDEGGTIPPELARYLAGCGCCDDTPGGNRAGGGQGAP